ncbi:electron transport complex subunit RsxA, partial [bacterium]|nr:electron transport complex subunit RsxA [candidate division CSSED10-310 bacterium]
MSTGFIIKLAIYAMLINNVVLMQFLGICPYLGVSKRVKTAFGMGMAVVFVMTLATLFTWLIDRYVLAVYNIQYLRTIAFILVIASLVQFVEIFLKKMIPVLYQSLGIYLPLITTNCAILGTAILAVQNDMTKDNLLISLVFAIATGVGFTIAIFLFASIRERLETSDIPLVFRG